MPRAVRDTRLDTRAARSKLKPQREPYWRAIDRGAHLGYRKGKTGGFWIGRHRGVDRKYSFESLGAADDAQDADGVAVLDFYQAQAKAREWFAEQARRAAGLTPDRPYSVADAMADYLDWFSAHRKSVADVRYRINAFMLPSLGHREVAKLTPQEIRKWHEGLACLPPRLRTGIGKPQQFREASNSPEFARRRRASANKVLTILKAALNHAWRDGKVPTDSAWRRVTPFRDVDAAKVRYLSSDECTRLVNACEPDFRRLVQAALLTGCRYGELISMRYDDFDPEAGTVHVPTSKSGKSRYVPLNDEGAAFFTGLTAGRPGDELMFLRADGRSWGKSHQRRRLEDAARAALVENVSFHILRHTYGSALAMQGVPMGVIAHALGHADTRITEKHYAALAPSYIADTIRSKLPPLGIVEEGNVTRIVRKAGYFDGER